ncbi:AlpA family phage regulatory protein [Desulfovibrio sp. OttesenSCG-928-C06]|nr:AlpA family phage regulatory protein [Desulfovibrio sp. OttesenSCG-928-C06]
MKTLSPAQIDASQKYNTAQPMPMEGLMRVDQVLMHFPVSKAQLYQMIAEESFPRQIKIGRSSFWDVVEVRKFLKNAGATISVPE